MTHIQNITFQPDGAPYSEQFDDIYFDTESGYQQSNDVFLSGNNIHERLKNIQNDFFIAETGFGTGLNFLLTLQAYLNAYTDDNTLNSAHSITYISVEKFPLTKAQLARSLSILPDIAELTDLLLEQYPEKIESDVTLSLLDGKVSLIILFGDATEKLTEFVNQKIQESNTIRKPFIGLIDAWYLDGFTPAKNPEMWQLPLFEQIAILSKPQATISTFTVAGLVRRNLSKVGFRTEKKESIGKKEQLLTGVFQQVLRARQGYRIRPKLNKPQRVTIIGGGIAAASAAYSLTKKGIKVLLYCKESTVAQGASSNAIGALYPLLHQQKDDISLFYQTAFWHAKRMYQQLLDDGFHFSHDWCGLLDISYKDSLKKRQLEFSKINAWPKDLITSIDNVQASQKAKIPLKHGGLFMPNAGWICPPELVKQLFNAAQATGRLRIQTNCHISGITQTENNTWQMHSSEGDINTEVLIICGGAESLKINIVNDLPLTSVRGQVSSISSNKTLSALSTVICHKGYLTPAHNNRHCIGATFTKDSFDTEAKKEDDNFNIDMLSTCLPELVDKEKPQVVSGKARLRCMTPDHMPMVGAMPDLLAHKSLYAHLAKDKNWKYDEPAPYLKNLYVMTGLGARGLCSAPLLADILTADIANTPYPIDDEMLFNLAPNRFVIRDIIKRKV